MREGINRLSFKSARPVLVVAAVAPENGAGRRLLGPVAAPLLPERTKP
jgi:hypothetical protein